MSWQSWHTLGQAGHTAIVSDDINSNVLNLSYKPEDVPPLQPEDVPPNLRVTLYRKPIPELFKHIHINDSRINLSELHEFTM